MGEEGALACRGVRGAITVDGVDRDAVAEATEELVEALRSANDVRPDYVAGAIFTVTAQLASANPAAVARAIGWETVPMLVVKEATDADNAPIIRLLVLWNTPKSQAEIKHVYLRGAAALRPDLSSMG